MLYNGYISLILSCERTSEKRQRCQLPLRDTSEERCCDRGQLLRATRGGSSLSLPLLIPQKFSKGSLEIHQNQPFGRIAYTMFRKDKILKELYSLNAVPEWIIPERK